MKNCPSKSDIVKTSLMFLTTRLTGLNSHSVSSVYMTTCLCFKNLIYSSTINHMCGIEGALFLSELKVNEYIKSDKVPHSCT